MFNKSNLRQKLCVSKFLFFLAKWVPRSATSGRPQSIENIQRQVLSLDTFRLPLLCGCHSGGPTRGCQSCNLLARKTIKYRKICIDRSQDIFRLPLLCGRHSGGPTWGCRPGNPLRTMNLNFEIHNTLATHRQNITLTQQKLWSVGSGAQI